MENQIKKKTKENNYGIKSLTSLGISVICFILYFMTFKTNELISGIFFYSGLTLDILSFILGLIGILKDKKKTLSIISVIIFTLFIITIIFYIYVMLPKAVEEIISNWRSYWGIK